MALIIRIDVDRAYGKQNLLHQAASRVASDYWLPRMNALGYLRELEQILTLLNDHGRQAHVFFRRCTYPTAAVCRLMEAGGHDFGLHLEDSRTEQSFLREHHDLESRIGRRIVSYSKHGSGVHQYGWHHHAPYEPERYLPWGHIAGMKLFLGNLEDPTLPPVETEGQRFFPSAFWLEPHWRDTVRFPIEWLLNEARQRDVVMLLHPDNVTADPQIMREFRLAIQSLETCLGL